MVRFAEAARALGLPTIFGAELTLGRTAPTGPGRAAPIPAAGPPGEPTCWCWPATRRATPAWPGPSAGPRWRGEKGAPRTQPRRAGRAGRLRGDAATGWCSPGAARARCRPRSSADGPAAAARELGRLVERLRPRPRGRRAVGPRRPARLGPQRRPGRAGRPGRGRPRRHQQRALRHARPAGRWPPRWPRCGPGAASTSSTAGCPAAAGAHLRSGAEQARRFARYPGVVERAAELGPRAAPSTSRWWRPSLPPFPCPAGPRRDGRGCAALTERGGRPSATARRERERVAGRLRADRPRARRSSSSSASPATSSIVWDIVEFCRRADIFCQGRGSAANSAVCYALGITNADAVKLGLLFERFLSPERDGPPDIDIDIESDRREEVIQYVYERYGRAATPPRSPTSSPTGPSRRCATWPRPSATPPASRTPGRSRSTAGVRWPPPPARPTTTSRRRCSSWPRRSSTSPATSASTRAAW